MKKRITYRSISASLLALLLMSVLLLREAHHFADHHGESLTCNSDEGHIHSDAYAPRDCIICLFHFSPADYAPDAWIPGMPLPSQRSGPLFTTSHVPENLSHTFFVRGPPCLTV